MGSDMLLSALFILLSFLGTQCAHVRHHSASLHRIPLQELDADYWIRVAQAELNTALNRKTNTNVAKNVILFLGDGMGPSTVTAARILKGQQKGTPGEEEKLVFENFPNVAFSKTYNVDHQVTDSAATATAFLCGVKANYGTLGVGPGVKRGDCPALQRKSTGFITTSRITHATPAPLYSKTPDRMWEGQVPIEAQREGCADIASQLLDPVGNRLNVVMGGGRKFLLPDTEQDPEKRKLRGSRKDGRNLIFEWIRDKQRSGLRAQYAKDRASFNAIDPSEVDYLMGLFEYSHMQYEGDRRADENGDPSLADMVEKGIDVLSHNQNGFFLLVEGARIDHAHHENTARRALEEVLSMEEALVRTMQKVNLEETLIIVTADHSHPLTISSYATRGNPILGLTDYGDDINRNGLSDVDGLPFTTLSYATGPGYQQSPRPNLTETNTGSRRYRQTTSVPTKIVTHEGTDVGIYAIGPMSHLFHTTHEQHYIFHAMVHASCMGRSCNAQKDDNAAIYRSRNDFYVSEDSSQFASGRNVGVSTFSALSMAHSLLCLCVVKLIILQTF